LGAEEGAVSGHSRTPRKIIMGEKREKREKRA